MKNPRFLDCPKYFLCTGCNASASNLVNNRFFLMMSLRQTGLYMTYSNAKELSAGNECPKDADNDCIHLEANKFLCSSAISIHSYLQNVRIQGMRSPIQSLQKSKSSPRTAHSKKYREQRKNAETKPHGVFQMPLNDELSFNFCNEQQRRKVQKEEVDV